MTSFRFDEHEIVSQKAAKFSRCTWELADLHLIVVLRLPGMGVCLSVNVDASGSRCSAADCWSLFSIWDNDSKVPACRLHATCCQ